MTETAEGSGSPVGADGDPFVLQVGWLIAAAGGKEHLVARCGGLVSTRTLDNWMAGNYPRTKVTGAVRALDTWAREHVAGYPEGAGVPGLVESCGPYRQPVRTVPSAAPPVEPAEITIAEPLPAEPRFRWPRRAAWAAALLLVLAVAVAAVVIVQTGSDDPAVADEEPAPDLVDVPLPSTGDGTVYIELSGSIGANTFADPRTLQGQGADIPPNTEVEVRCRYYAPSVPSVTPDGFWYLIESEEWNGRWTPANSFMNGDVPGGPYIHNTDFAVPVCR